MRAVCNGHGDVSLIHDMLLSPSWLCSDDDDDDDDDEELLRLELEKIKQVGPIYTVKFVSMCDCMYVCMYMYTSI